MGTLKPVRAAALEPRSAVLLECFGPRFWADDLYLAGSAALTLYIGQRRVRDLDLMSGNNRLRAAERRDLLADLLELEGATEVETARDGFLSVRLGEIAVRFFYYPYPLIDPLESFHNVAVASAVDLALMKLGAIISRGTKRDFVDFYLLCRELSLETVLDRSKEKFGHVRDFHLQALKGLSDMSLAIDEPMPLVETSVEWADIEEWIHLEVRRLGRERVGLPESGEVR
jgi:hypothetical protein